MDRDNTKNESNKKPIDAIDMNLINIIKYNQGIRVATAKRLIDALYESKFIDTKEGVYVKFMTNKFSVVANGLANEFRYNMPLVIQSLINAHNDFCDKSREIIAEYCKHNGLKTAQDDKQ